MMNLEIEEKNVQIFPAQDTNTPIIYLNNYAHDGEKVYEAVLAAGCPDCTLVTVGKLKWDRDMTPWYTPPSSEHDTPCTGGADDYLKILTESIVPQVESSLGCKPAWRGIAGYSLAGLFAVYSIFHTDAFSRVGSMSGSLWFKDIKEYIFAHKLARVPDCMYFSLGDKESSSRISAFQCVQDNTEAIEAFFRGKGIPTTYVLNRGSHYQKCNERTAAGIKWMLEQK